ENIRVRAVTSDGAALSGVSLTAIGTLQDGGTEEVPLGRNSGTDAPSGGVIGEHSVTPGNDWTHIQVRASLSGLSIKYVYSLGVYEAAGATLIQDGAVTTEKIAAGSITAESGIIGSIDANVITVGKIMGNQLDADAINGKTITGAKIRTASSGSRVELTHNGLKQYNSLGATIVDMTAGSFTLQGGSITGSTIKTASSGSRVEITTQGLKQFNADDDVIAEMVDGSMVMRGILEQENSTAKMQVGPAWASDNSPGIRWFGIDDHPGWEPGLAIVMGDDRASLALQGPSKVPGKRGALLNLFDNRIYAALRGIDTKLDMGDTSTYLSYT